MKKVAVTGGTGCLGKPLIKKLLKDGCSINLLREIFDKSAFDSPNINYFIGNISERSALKKLLNGCDIVFHLAGLVHKSQGAKFSSEDYFKTNLNGTKFVLDIAKEMNVKRVVFYSTVAVYGETDHFPLDENSPCHPVTPYAISKYQAEQLVLSAYKNGGPEGVVLRFPVVYGPFDRGNVSSLIRAISKKSFFYFGKGNAKRSMISSENAAEAAFFVGNSPNTSGQIYCVTDCLDYTISEIVNIICEELNTSWRPNRQPLIIAKTLGLIGDILELIIRKDIPINTDRVYKLSTDFIVSSLKIQSIGYRPIQSIREGIRNEIAWIEMASQTYDSYK